MKHRITSGTYWEYFCVKCGWNPYIKTTPEKDKEERKRIVALLREQIRDLKNAENGNVGFDVFNHTLRQCAAKLKALIVYIETGVK